MTANDFLFGCCPKVLTMIRLEIAITNLGHNSLAAAVALLLLRQQLRDSQPGWCVAIAAVPGLDGSKRREERVKHWACLIFFFPVPSNMWLTFIFLCTEA